MGKGLGNRRIFWGVGGACVTVGLLFACASLVRKDDRIIFSHAKHVKENELGCEECHAPIKKSEKITEATWPTEKKCMDCHEKTEGKCGQCHTDPAKPKTWEYERTPSVSFSHEYHLEMTEGKCEPCHADIPGQTATHESTRPISHDVCMECHRNDFRKIDCKMCHKDLVENPSKPAHVFNHDADFSKRHGMLAKGDEGVCAHCHRQNFCADCHSRMEVLLPDQKLSQEVGRELVHRGDFLTRHPIEARADPNKCMKCHTLNQCQSCHADRRVSAGLKKKDLNGNLGPASNDPHPKGWATQVNSPDFHGAVARRDILACATCHDQGPASICVTCHKVGGIGGNPHPKGYDPIKQDGNRMCRYCHTNGVGM